MHSPTTSGFDLPDRLAAKADPALIAGDERHFAVMAEAEQVIRTVLPDANVPASIRSGGAPVVYGSVSDLDSVLDTWLAAHADGVACVIGAGDGGEDAFRATPRVRWLTPELSKGLEFDLVVLIDPESFGKGIEGVVDRYVAMTRATGQLVILTSA